jgi:hypothetical protein
MNSSADHVAVAADAGILGKGAVMPRSITGILIVVILILLVIFLLQRV